VLAYSTVSQLGYMFAGVGVGAPFAAIFHLVTHASFKALLFLSAGVVIHARHGHEELASLGGLRRALPGAYLTFLIGSLALIGIPVITAGAFSKDLILEASEQANLILFLGLFLTVGLTGYYIGRLFFGVFHGPRPDDGEAHLHEPGLMLWPLVPLAIGALVLGYLEWPVGLLSSVLGATVGHAEAVHPVSLVGSLAALLGLAGFALSGWRGHEQAPAPARAAADPPAEGVHPVTSAQGGWVGAVADAGLGLAGRLAGVHSGHLGRYVLASVLGVAVILLVGLLASGAGISTTLAPGSRP
jgi:NADH-quinone oxidoreductase subunit L